MCKKHIGMLIKCLDNKIAQQLNKEFERFDLTLVQHEVLAYLYFHKYDHDIYQKEIEEHLRATNPTVTGIVKRLEAKGLIRREACILDARYKKLLLTEKGECLLKETMVPGPKKMEKKLTKDLSEEEAQQLIYLLEKVLQSLDEENI